MRNPLLVVIIATAILFTLVNLFIKPPTYSDPHRTIKYAQETEQPDLEKEAYRILLKNDSNNLEYNRGYLEALSNANISLAGDALFDTYLEKKYSPNPAVHDFGCYCLGYCYTLLKVYPTAIENYHSTFNNRMKYLNNSLGWVYLQIGKTHSAENCFRAEIENDGNLEGAYYNLSNLLFSQQRYAALFEMSQNKEVLKYMPLSVVKSTFLHYKKIPAYIFTEIKQIYLNCNLIGFLAALLITICWLIYLHKIDIYEPEKWRILLFTFFVGAFFSLFTSFFYDISHNYLNFYINGEISNDFLYCITTIGMNEEFFKIIPFLILLMIPKLVNEPLDYIILPAVSALGFAFIENLMYFDTSQLHIIHGRALVSVVMHMFLSSFIGYGLMLSRYKFKKGFLFFLLLFFLVSAFIHGFFDFWYINKQVIHFSIISSFLVLFCVSFWNGLINNGLNQSGFFNKRKKLHNENLLFYLVYALTAIFLFEYLVVSIKYGAETGNDVFWGSFRQGTYLIAFMSIQLSAFNITKGKWLTFKYLFYRPEPRFCDLDAVVGKTVELHLFTPGSLSSLFLPNKGKIIRRETFSNINDWYVVKLNDPPVTDEYCNKYVLVRSKIYEGPVQIGAGVLVGCYAIPDESLLTSENKEKDDFVFMGWAKIP